MSGNRVHKLKGDHKFCLDAANKDVHLLRSSAFEATVDDAQEVTRLLALKTGHSVWRVFEEITDKDGDVLSHGVEKILSTEQMYVEMADFEKQQTADSRVKHLIADDNYTVGSYKYGYHANLNGAQLDENGYAMPIAAYISQKASPCYLEKCSEASFLRTIAQVSDMKFVAVAQLVSNSPSVTEEVKENLFDALCELHDFTGAADFASKSLLQGGENKSEKAAFLKEKMEDAIQKHAFHLSDFDKMQSYKALNQLGKAVQQSAKPTRSYKI